MKGSLVHRGRNRWSVVLDLGYVTDATTGKKKRKQKWITVNGTREQADIQLTKLVGSSHDDTFINPSKRTVGEWLAEWLEKSVKPTRRPRTYATYTSVIHSLTATLGAIPLQKLKPIDVQAYYAKHAKLAPATMRLHAATLSAAVKSAVKNGMVVRNVVPLADGRPKIAHSADAIVANCLDVDEARRLLAAAKTAGPRAAAFYALALDSGARIAELAGLKWTDIDIEKGQVKIMRQLAAAKLTEEKTVQFGPTKTGRVRTIDVGPETVALLKAHRRNQNELKMKHRANWRECGLVFTKEQSDALGVHLELGTPIQFHNVNDVGEFPRLLDAAKCKRITFHGLRHSSATLLLVAGTHVKIVSERLGHAKVSVTMDVYSHVLPTMQRGAAASLSAVLHGERAVG